MKICLLFLLFVSTLFGLDFIIVETIFSCHSLGTG